ncbi:hypothetical protein RIF29_17473 [Crotalaria pallida]|uniref:Uncharacterized protein n=1 Tax=Crotalaria pallida TaxID=3830 RepID=A0AAN9FIF3_CROPI
MSKPSDDAEFNNKTELEAELGFPSEFPYEFEIMEPIINSPVESVAGSTETESSDEEDFFAGLTRRLSQASLHETRPSQLTLPIINSNNKAEIQKKVRVISGSPQSTLSGIGSWSGRSPGSGEGSPNATSRVPSPNTTPFSNDAWDAIYAAAEHVARLKMNDAVSKFDFQNRALHRSFPSHTATENRPTPLFPNQSLHPNLNHASQVHLRQEHMLKQQQCDSLWGREQQQRIRGYGSVRCTRTLPQSAWHHPLQVKQQNPQNGGSGLRPVLNGGSGGKRGCAGTGVFLPRQYVAPPEPRKKPSCAPVIVPAKVIHALNLNTHDLNATSDRLLNAYGADYNALLARRNAILMQQKLSLMREEAAANYEIRLPQDWTY